MIDNLAHSLNQEHSFQLRAVSDMLGLNVLNHTDPVTWGISWLFIFSSRVELLTRKARGKRK
jgi:hypothetical protein